jgi:hypothetical protein
MYRREAHTEYIGNFRGHMIYLLQNIFVGAGKLNEEETSSAFNVVAITVCVLHNLTRLHIEVKNGTA